MSIMPTQSQYSRYLEKNKCPVCVKRPPAPNYSTCDVCRPQRAAQAQRYYKKNREKILTAKRKRRHEALAAKQALEASESPPAAFAAEPLTREALEARLIALRQLGASKGLSLDA